MAQTILEARDESVVQPNGSLDRANQSEFDLTSFSIFNACLMAMVIAAPIWASIAYILMR